MGESYYTFNKRVSSLQHFDPYIDRKLTMNSKIDLSTMKRLSQIDNQNKH